MKLGSFCEKSKFNLRLKKYKILLILIGGRHLIFFDDLSDRTVAPSDGSGFVSI